MRCALAAIGWPAATVDVEAIERRDARDDIDCLAAVVRWRVHAAFDRVVAVLGV